VLHKKNEKLFSICPATPTPGTKLFQTIPHPRARRAGLVPGVAREGMVTRKIEPCINAVSKKLSPNSSQKCIFTERSNVVNKDLTLLVVHRELLHNLGATGVKEGFLMLA